MVANEATSDLKPVSNFETNPSSFPRSARRVAESAPASRFGASPTAFRQFLNEKQRGGASQPQRVAPLKPTEERLAKEDRPKKTAGGFFRARHPLERLRDQGKLDHSNGAINSAMFEAAERLYRHWYESGLSGIKAQDISRAVGAGDGGACAFPRNDRAMMHRQHFRIACTLMGWHEAAPYRGAGRLVVDIVCYEMGVKEAALIHCPGRNESALANGMDRLREGLFALAVHWKLF